MAISIQVRWDEGPLSVSSNSASSELKYIATSNDPVNDGRDDVLLYLSQNAPASLFGLIIDEITVSERIFENAVEAKWDCTVAYIAPHRKQPYPMSSLITVGQPRPVRFSIRNGSAGTVNQIRSLQFIGETVSDPNLGFGSVDAGQYLNFEANPSENSAINFTVKGVAKQLYNVEIAVETAAYASEINGGYAVSMALYAGKNVLNSVAWRGFPVRSLKFTGFNLRQQADDNKDQPQNNLQNWDMDLTFAYQPPETINYPSHLSPIQVGGSPVTVKQGHEYLDGLYMDSTIQADGGTVKFTIPRLVRLALHRLEEEVNYDTTLGLGNIM